MRINVVIYFIAYTIFIIIMLSACGKQKHERHYFNNEDNNHLYKQIKQINYNLEKITRLLEKEFNMSAYSYKGKN